ncbi:restriction endonuclease subunit S [Staphylococcus xylosus]|uniref:restriction endonuclease subunit S n=1 Tax=Staphylococcus xylosus TaxID=1288 RepID=UPI003F552D8C
MNNEIKNVPELRFPEFSGEWKEKELGQCTNLITKGTTPKDKSGKGTINYIKVENIYNAKIKPRMKININEHEGYLKRSKLEANDILFSIAGTLGRTAVVNKSHLPANTNQALAIIRGYDFETNFLITTLGGHAVAKYIRKNPTVGAQPNLSLNQVSKLIINTPSKNEQKKIGIFFSKLDRQIELEEQKLEKLEEQKKGYMQKIFSQELRFKDENCEYYSKWEKDYLGNRIKQYFEKTKINNEYPVLTSSREGIFLQKDYFTRDVASKDNTGYNVVPYGYFTYRHMSDDLVFKFNINTIVKKGIVSTLYPVFKTKDNLNSLFLKEYLNHGTEFKRYALLQKQGGSRTYMYFNKLIKLELKFPILNEQNKISNFLNEFDELVEKQNLKVKRLKERKKGFLQKMFV